MGRHICLKQWLNGNEISVSIDDNSCDRFRAEVVVFYSDSDNIEERIDIGGSRCPTHMAELIKEAEKYALKNKGNRTPFDARILTNHEGLED